VTLARPPLLVPGAHGGAGPPRAIPGIRGRRRTLRGRRHDRGRVTLSDVVEAIVGADPGARRTGRTGNGRGRRQCLARRRDAPGRCLHRAPGGRAPCATRSGPSTRAGCPASGHPPGGGSGPRGSRCTQRPPETSGGRRPLGDERRGSISGTRSSGAAEVVFSSDTGGGAGRRGARIRTGTLRTRGPGRAWAFAPAVGPRDPGPFPARSPVCSRTPSPAAAGLSRRKGMAGRLQRRHRSGGGRHRRATRPEPAPARASGLTRRAAGMP
jgi:hypothetical protein